MVVKVSKTNEDVVEINEDEIFEEDVESTTDISEFDVDLELSDLAAQFIYSTKEKWAKDAFVLLAGSTAQKIRREIQNAMEKEGISLHETEDSKTSDLKSGRKPPSLIFIIGEILNTFIKRRLKDSENYTDVKHDISSENKLITRIISNLIPLLGERVIKWLGIKISKKHSKKGKIGYSPEGFRNFLRMAQFIPEEYILDEIEVNGEPKKVGYSHYTFMSSYRKEILINQRRQIPILIETLNNRIKEGGWTTNHSQKFRDLLKELGKENNDRWPKSRGERWEDFFEILMERIINEIKIRRKLPS